MRSVLFILFLFSCLNLKAQEIISLDYFPVWEMPNNQFNGIALNLSNGGNLDEAASNLFKMLRFLDKTETNEIVVAPIPNKDLGLAINDKLKRASS